jgi:3-phytase
MMGCVYIGEEEVGLWKYNAAPDASPSDRTIIDTMAPQGHLSRDIEGLAIFYGPYGSGYLIASSQGNDEFLVYEREGDNAYVGSFRIGRGVGIDEVTHTDGIDVSSVSFSETFASGVFVAQDDENPGSTQNFKLVPWEAIAKSFSPPLRAEGDRNPRIKRFELMSRQ